MTFKSQREETSEILQHYGVRLDQETSGKIDVYTSLLCRWNERVALTTVTDHAQIATFHFGESIFAASAIPINSGMIADLGTGAGFPGIPLKLVRPQLHLTLIESNLKKCAFLSEVIRTLNLGDVDVVRKRFEEVEITGFDFVVSRAVGNIEKMLGWGRNALNHSGKVILWLGAEDAKEVSRYSEHWKWSEPIPIPGSERRVLLPGDKS